MKDGNLVADDSPEELVTKVNGNNLEDVYMYYCNSQHITDSSQHNTKTSYFL